MLGSVTWLKMLLIKSGASSRYENSFAGAFAGHLAHSKNYSFSSISNALIYANAVASFCVEKFGVENMLDISKEEINERIDFIKKT